MERRIEAAIRDLEQLTADTEENDSPARLSALQKYYAEPRDSQGSILDLEFKLYALRHPESMAELSEPYQRLYPKEEAAKYFGVQQESSRSRAESRFRALGALRSGLILSMLFQPNLFTTKEVRLILGEVFNGLFPDIEKRQEKTQ